MNKKILLITSIFLLIFSSCANEDDEIILNDSKSTDLLVSKSLADFTHSNLMPCTDASEVCDDTMIPQGSTPTYFFGFNSFSGVIYTSHPGKAVSVTFRYSNVGGNYQIINSSITTNGLRMAIDQKQVVIEDNNLVRVYYSGSYTHDLGVLSEDEDDNDGNVGNPFIVNDTTGLKYEDGGPFLRKNEVKVPFHNSFIVNLNTQEVY